MYSKTLLETSTIASIGRLEWNQVKSLIRMLIRSVTGYMDKKIISIRASLRRETKSESRKSKTFTKRATHKVSIAFYPDFVLRILFRLVGYNLYYYKFSKKLECLLLYPAKSGWR